MCFYFIATATSEIYTDVHPLSPHYARPIGTLLAVEGLNGVAARVVDGSDTIIAYLGSMDRPGYHAIGKHINDVAPGNGAFSEAGGWRSEEHTPELQSLMRISYAVFCLKNNTTNHTNQKLTYTLNSNH